MRKLYLEKKDILTLLIIIYLMSMLMGALGNFLVIQSNKGQMPVYWDSNYENEIHKCYDNWRDYQKVDYWILGDIIGIRGYAMYSIGDFFLFGGLGCFIISILFWFYIIFNQSKHL